MQARAPAWAPAWAAESDTRPESQKLRTGDRGCPGQQVAVDDQRVTSTVRVKAAGTSGSISASPSPGGRTGRVFTPKLHGILDGNALPSPDTCPGGLLRWQPGP